MNYFRTELENLLSLVDIKINGDRPWDVQVHDDRTYKRFWTSGSLGLGEAYMDAWWDCERLDELFYRVLKAQLDRKVKKSVRTLYRLLIAKVFNLQSRGRAHHIAQSHYDLDNELFSYMLDKRLVYTCAYWNGASTLEEAQERKLDLVCKKIGLEPGMTVLDLGCGWGSFAKYAAEKYRTRVVGVNISREQVSLGREMCQGLPVEFRLQDYREAEGQYDRVISIEIMQHVGPKNYPRYMEVVDRCLKEDGIAFIQTGGGNEPSGNGDPWFEKYIFPNGIHPSLMQLCRAMEGRFILEDLHNIGPHYDQTLMEWNSRFQQSWPHFKKKYPERFKRMWEYYLLCSAGAFRSRSLQVWQIAFARPGGAQPRCRIS